MQSFGFFYKKEKVQSFNKMHPVFSYSEKNPSNSQKNPENSKNYVIKKSKENISRRSSKGERRTFLYFSLLYFTLLFFVYLNAVLGEFFPTCVIRVW